ncbi:MAG: hypothetical protein JXB48_07490 [Candidatus Latescibacteria bacterium]|nr:hypothetical protein [Candidatus Latescibacterota bacterium]
MNRCEKIAWFNLAVVSAAAVLYILFFLLLRIKFDFFLSAQVATSVFSLIALSAFGPLIFKQTGVLIDEHGEMIRQKHGLLKYIVFWAVYFSIFLAIWIWKRISGTTADQINLLVVFISATVAFIFAFTLVLYFKRQKESRLTADDQENADVILYGPDMDERDLKIHKSARSCGFGVFWLIYVAAFMGTWGWSFYRGYRTISVNVNALPLFVFGAFILIYAVDSITTVILYRRGK